MAEEKIYIPKPGDVVRVRSGGPDMTASYLQKNADSTAMCVWFDKEEKPQQGSFLFVVLEKLEVSGPRVY